MVEHATTCPIAQGTGTDCRCQCVPDAHQGYATPAALPAGRSLDAAIAERVMGAKWLALPPEGRGLYHPQINNGWCLVYRYVSTGRTETEAACPRFSTDMSAAWLVVDELREQQGDWEQYWTFIDCCDVWRAELWQVPNQSDAPVLVARAVEKTLPLAICRTALDFKSGAEIPPQAEEVSPRRALGGGV